MAQMLGPGAEPRSGAVAPPRLPALAPVSRETMQQQVYLQLRQAIMAGRFRPGQTITLRSVAEALDVSHMPVRGALHRLEAEGAVSSSGARRSLTIPTLDAAEMAELRDIRAQLEGLAAERAAGHVTDAELAALQRHCEAMRAAAERDDIDGYIQENWAFHTAVYKASRMVQLLAIVEGLWLRAGPHVRLMLPTRPMMLATIPTHQEVVDALAARDGPRARRAIAADITVSAAHLIESLPESAP